MKWLDAFGRAHLFDNSEYLECSNCGAEYDDDGNYPKEWAFCPLCGKRLSEWSDMTADDLRENDDSWRDR